ncbi:MAG TPA: hypothetical protein VH328_02050 [Burkholderiaceae bacterium]|nr:hypothetical protein [Burkholderiaceae bacterium]
MPCPILLLTEVTPGPGALGPLAAAWAAVRIPDVQRALYVAHDESSVLELLALPDVASVATLRPHWETAREDLGPYLASDFRRQLLEFVEAPKSCSGPLPATPWLQLRHVEVPPAAHDDYLGWRDRTIFDVVRKASEVEVFLAYHSVVSTEPGVMFLSGFSADVQAYGSVFSSPRYQEIVREAGAQFITGGDKGLYTKIYRRHAA